MFTIHLHHLQFYAYHGVYAEETISGSSYEVSADVKVEEAADEVTELHQTVDYTTIYRIIKEQMAQPVALLETLSQSMVHAIGQLDKRIKSVSLTIQKLQPPLTQYTGSIGVTYTREF